ncbi:SLC13 family permease [Arenicella xantha]|uniref:Sodium-dependent dicarboxylate transporter 2/3/5 n=1 Tax=Arenicella xantha TaxID=644221 RepID=A0A395JKQ3_9GAMM|nr:SLC13 family permease [Arenicella xantha]RBP49771.1 sodium-dependent dicarboxylate transporter 2/3/5 [Arenicella xantha]
MLNLRSHLLLGPIMALSLYTILLSNGLNHSACATAAITLLTAWWWATEALPIPATSLLPFTLFPLMGVLDHKTAASGLGSHIIMLMLGGFMMAKALERTGAHQRFAVLILRRVGPNSAKRLVAAFMLSGALLSMWVSNTATCLMLMPIALACLKQVNQPKLTAPLIIAIAYTCSIGGIATLVGTPPNVIFAGVFVEVIGREFGFLDWMKIGVPVVLVLLPVTWLWLTRNVSGECSVTLPNATPWSNDEKRVVWVFALIVFLWIFRSQPFGGWTGLLDASGIGDSTVALLGAALMFVVRSERGGGLLDWPTARSIPWSILLMFGAGITIAKAFFESGLADLIGAQMSGVVGALPIYVVMLMICLGITFFTEINSNLATTTLVLPILAATAASTGMAPELLMIPATISASCAFMLPVATAPNAIAYATEQISVRQMLREGLVLNILFAFIISALCYVIL